MSELFTDESVFECLRLLRCPFAGIGTVELPFQLSSEDEGRMTTQGHVL